MHPIFINSLSEGHGFHTFYDRFIEICESHKKDKRALAFAFILYDFENPQIAKILNDQDYWLALNSISGSNLTVFSIHHKPMIRARRPYKRSNSNIIPQLVKTNYHSNPSTLSTPLIKKYFGDNTAISYPAILFFQVENGKTIDQILIELDKTELEASFLELKEYISSATNALKRIAEDSKENSKEIFNQVVLNIEGVKLRNTIKRGVKLITSTKELGQTVIESILK